jgi:hypothetical protein
MKSSRVLFVSAMLYCAAAAAYADSACDKTQQQYRYCVRLVDSLRPDKAGQMRVFAADGSEFNAGQVQWMKGQLRKFDKLCASGAAEDEAQAAKVLAGVQELLDSHRRRS